MTLELIPMLLLSLLLLTSDGADAGVAHLVLSGDHRLDATDEAVIVGDATVTLPAHTEVTAPVYVIGGTTRIDGTVRARVTQIAGTMIVAGDAEIADLRHIGGARTIHPDADVARRTSVDVAAGTDTPVRSVVLLAVVAAVLAAVGARLERTRRRNLDTTARAIARHPVVTVTVGALLVLTALSLLVFMAFTLVLIPVSILGLLAGVIVAALGVIAWGHRLGPGTSRCNAPTSRPPPASQARSSLCNCSAPCRSSATPSSASSCSPASAPSSSPTSASPTSSPPRCPTEPLRSAANGANATRGRGAERVAETRTGDNSGETPGTKPPGRQTGLSHPDERPVPGCAVLRTQRRRRRGTRA